MSYLCRTMKPVKLLIALLLALLPSLMRVQADTTVFALLDLTRPGLERVAELHAAGDDKAAAEALLDYYRRRTGVVCPGCDPAGITITPKNNAGPTRRWSTVSSSTRATSPPISTATTSTGVLAREGQRTALAAAPHEMVGADGQSLPPLGRRTLRRGVVRRIPRLDAQEPPHSV